MVDTIVLTNGSVYHSGGACRKAAIVVRGDRILRVAAEGERYTPLGEFTEIDLRGATVLPGFVDTHFHLTSMALKASRCDLAGSGSASDVLARLAEHAASREGPVVGVDWDEASWQDRQPPTRKALDGIDAVRPVLARRVCGHIGVVNTPLLRQIKGHAALVDRVTGVVREHALWEAGALCDPGPEAVVSGLEPAIRRLHTLGITAIHDIVEPGRFDAYLDGVTRASAPLRIDMLLHVHPRDIDHYMERAASCDPTRVRLAGVKCFLDGSFGGRTAALREPYPDGGGRGTLLLSDDSLLSIVRASYDKRIACAIHAIGDRAIDQALTALETLPADAAGFRIEHCELAGRGQRERLARRRVTAAMQPNFVRNWGVHRGLYEERLGAERLRSCNPFRSMVEAGVDVVFGSDGMPPGPLYGLEGAVTHPVAGERLQPAQAIDLYTRRPNTLPAHRREAGEIEAGQLADLVVLDRDPLGGDFDRISVIATIVGGEVVYRAEETPFTGLDTIA